MKNQGVKVFVPAMFFLLFSFFSLSAQDLEPIKLLAPQIEIGKTLMQALKERRSIRDFDTKALPLQVLSDLLWAANGINRVETGQRTAPSAKNMQEVDIYLADANGLYRYDAMNFMLLAVLAGDLRPLTGTQPFVKDAPLELIYVADLSKMGDASVEDKNFYSATDSGFISQNVYLYCASAGLGTVVRRWYDEKALAKAMKLKPSQKIILAQTVGYPKQEF